MKGIRQRYSIIQENRAYGEDYWRMALERGTVKMSFKL